MKQTPNSIDLLVGNNISDIRMRSGITVAETASAVGVPANELLSMEAGRLRIGASLLQRLCAFLKVPPADVFAGHQIDEAGEISLSGG